MSTTDLPDNALTEDEENELYEAEKALVERRLDWDGERADASDAVAERAANYADYVNKVRAFPDIRDGLLSGQRRVIFTMASDFRLRFSSPKTVKSMKIIGAVIGNYHPHGDTSTYGSMVRMAQSWTMNVPLVEGQGNFGSIDKDPPAAARYTEAKLSEAGTLIMDDLSPEIVDYRPNYDESETEARVLPITFPALLVNGAFGTGWAIRCNVPTHNLAEVIDAAILVADNPDVTVKQVMKKLPGPDFPTRGIMLNRDKLERAYTLGRGTFLLQARYHIENTKGNQQQIVITELPYNIGPEDISAETKAKAQEGKITEVTEEVINKTSGAGGIQVIIKVKRGGNVNVLIAQLMKHTSLQITVPINFTVLVDGQQRTVSLIEILSAFVDFRRQVVTRRLEAERKALIKRLHELVALVGALDVIDAVIKIIRGSANRNEAREGLMKLIKVEKAAGGGRKVPIDEDQANFILDMRLSSLTKLNRFEIEEEIKIKRLRVVAITEILDDPAAITDIVKTELRDNKRRFGRPRQTIFAGESDVVPALVDGKAPQVAAIPKTPVTIFASASGMALAVETGSKVRDESPLVMGSSDRPVAVISTDTDAQLHAFTSGGSCYRVRVADLGIESRKGKGRALVNLTGGETLVALLPVDQGERLAFVTEQGQIKRMDNAVFESSHAGGVPAMGGLDGDRIVAVVPHKDAGDELLVHTRLGRVLRTPLDFRLVKSGPAGGVALMKLVEPGDRIVSATVAAGSHLVVIHETGAAKAVALPEYPSKGRGGGGVASVDPSKPAKSPAGPVSLAFCVPSLKEAPVIWTTSGQRVSADLGMLQVAARGAVLSKPWLALGPGDAATLPA